MLRRSLLITLLIASATCGADEVPAGEPLANAAPEKPAPAKSAPGKPAQAKSAESGEAQAKAAGHLSVNKTVLKYEDNQESPLYEVCGGGESSRRPS